MIRLLKADKQIKVFLGGTCAESTWRDILIPMLNVNFFDPCVKDWNEEAQKEEERQKKICNYHLYVITPEMTGVFSIAEVVQDSNTMPKGTIFCILNKDKFDKRQLKSLEQVEKMVEKNGAHVFNSLEEIANFLNKGV